jgi:hypothetical protein
MQLTQSAPANPKSKQPFADSQALIDTAIRTVLREKAETLNFS